jgi:hypothetical protein
MIQVATMDESCQRVLAEGWPSFRSVTLEPPGWQRTISQPERRGRSR